MRLSVDANSIIYFLNRTINQPTVHWITQAWDHIHMNNECKDVSMKREQKLSLTLFFSVTSAPFAINASHTSAQRQQKARWSGVRICGNESTISFVTRTVRAKRVQSRHYLCVRNSHPAQCGMRKGMNQTSKSLSRNKMAYVKLTLKRFVDRWLAHDSDVVRIFFFNFHYIVGAAQFPANPNQSRVLRLAEPLEQWTTQVCNFPFISTHISLNPLCVTMCRSFQNVVGCEWSGRRGCCEAMHPWSSRSHQRDTCAYTQQTPMWTIWEILMTMSCWLINGLLVWYQDYFWVRGRCSWDSMRYEWNAGNIAQAG